MFSGLFLSRSLSKGCKVRKPRDTKLALFVLGLFYTVPKDAFQVANTTPPKKCFQLTNSTHLSPGAGSCFLRQIIKKKTKNHFHTSHLGPKQKPCLLTWYCIVVMGIVSHLLSSALGCESWTQVFCKNSKHSQPLSRPSSFIFFPFKDMTEKCTHHLFIYVSFFSLLCGLHIATEDCNL